MKRRIIYLETITGGLSNVMHRRNVKGETKINKFFWNPEKKCYEDRDTENIVTHVCGIDFNSLYPSCYSSAPHDFIKMMGYKEGKFFMPGSVMGEIEDKEKIMRIIKCGKNTKYLYVVSVKGYIPEDKLNKAANFPPIIRSIEIETSAETIGEYTYNLMVKNNIVKKGQVPSKKRTL